MKLFRPLIIALALLVALPAGVSASITQFQGGNSCTQIWNNSGQPVPFVCLTDEPNYGGDKLIFTGSSDHNGLNNLEHTLPGNCEGLGLTSWNDCVSSVWAKLGTNDSICLYVFHSYIGLIWWAHAPAAPSGGVWTYALADFGNNEDVTSSVRLQQSGTSCNDL